MHLLTPRLPEHRQQTEGARQLLYSTNVHQHNGGEGDVGSYEETKQGGDDDEGDVVSEEGHGEHADGGEKESSIDNK